MCFLLGLLLGGIVGYLKGTWDGDGAYWLARALRADAKAKDAAIDALIASCPCKKDGGLWCPTCKLGRKAKGRR